jgi:DNA-binding MarR family transcriptional regulator
MTRLPKISVSSPVSDRIIRVHAMLASAVQRADPHADLTFRQAAVLTSLRTGACTPGVKELADYLKLSRPTITRTLDRLETLKLARRSLNRDDRRLVNVILTPKGASLLSSIDAAA